MEHPLWESDINVYGKRKVVNLIENLSNCSYFSHI